MSMSDPLNHLGSICYHSKHLEVPYSPNQFIVVRFASFLSGGFIIAKVVNQSERKLAKRTSVHSEEFLTIQNLFFVFRETMW